MTPALAETLNTFFALEQLEARRILHGRGRSYPGLEHLCVDWFKPVVLVSTWREIADPAVLKSMILEADIHQQVESIVLQHRYENQSPAEALHGVPPERTIVKAQGLRFEIRPGRRQNAGLFLDTGPLREWLLASSDGKNVLNLFAYTCALSVAALAGGARAVTNVDMSNPSIQWGMQNHMLNGQGAMEIHNIPHNLFKSWGRIKQFGRYDIVIIDPPTHQRGSFNVEKNYKSVVKRMPELCNPGAFIIAALNSPFHDEEFLTNCVAENLPKAQLLEWLPVAEEFVESEKGRGLKIALYKHQ